MGKFAARKTTAIRQKFPLMARGELRAAALGASTAIAGKTRMQSNVRNNARNCTVSKLVLTSCSLNTAVRRGLIQGPTDRGSPYFSV